MRYPQKEDKRHQELNNQTGAEVHAKSAPTVLNLCVQINILSKLNSPRLVKFSFSSHKKPNVYINKCYCIGNDTQFLSYYHNSMVLIWQYSPITYLVLDPYQILQDRSIKVAKPKSFLQGNLPSKSVIRSILEIKILKFSFCFTSALPCLEEVKSCSLYYTMLYTVVPKSL